MIPIRRLLITTSLLFTLPGQVLAIAPVVDDSENYAMIEQQESQERALAQESPSQAEYGNEERPLAHDTGTVAASDNSMLLEKIQGLQQEVQELRGQLEVQTHDLKVLQEQQLSFYKDLDSRISSGSTVAAKAAPAATTTIALDTKPVQKPVEMDIEPTRPKTVAPAPVPVAEKNAQNKNNPADEQISYLAAYDHITNKQYDEALTAMQAFSEHYPQSTYAANAQYWLGELYMMKKDYSNAIDHFGIVVKEFPASSKTAASQLKIGYALAAGGHVSDAKRQLEKVIQTYPETNTAQLARAKLETLDA